ncbi:CCA tRNA nucleotidyltransferase [Barnesiella viscericola]|uniref:CCA tRNA nucleotidyltransferase n=1 Tax=Barnesiella viscericola TaxID=397865 RepID=UPI0024B75B5B|nr:HD domain-containing protein [Barnesiella viscericola]
MQADNQLILDHLDQPIFRLIGEVANAMNRPCFVIGGYVRDIFLHRPSKDIDIVTLGSGIELAEALAARLGKRAHLSTFRNFGTAQVKYNRRDEHLEIEFVGARKESYSHDSRKPVVEDGTLQDDQNRRDFTINALALCLNHDRWGELVDPFGGMADLERGIIRTPLDPDVTFSDDPLRMMRAIRFATQLNFQIEPETFAAIERNCSRIEIISKERIIDELGKIMSSDIPSKGFILLDECKLLPLIFPELSALKGVETVEGRGHKDNFYHTLAVLDNVALRSQNEWLRWAALLHDIGKPRTKRYDARLGWTFHNHNYVGEKMIPGIFRRMKLPLNDKMKYVQKLVGLHMRPIVLAEEVVTDSAVRRLLFDAGDDIDDLMILCESDITSKNREKVKRFLDNFELVRTKLREIEEKDSIRNMKLPIRGEEIMETFGLPPSRPVGEILSAIKEAILDGKIPNEHEPARQFMLETAATMGLQPVVK